ncbi:hypothetical protein OSB04_010316 [Centaurea solstitialis]|uniref:Lipoxygenase n=1 Tax=Centaurea solstitialis TaxID=347529 RepID=A0AA38TQE2_9ASTR|nr:hypothetical protein OSB04_010316 [Centaurea solstitialis]
MSSVKAIINVQPVFYVLSESSLRLFSHVLSPNHQTTVATKQPLIYFFSYDDEASGERKTVKAEKSATYVKLNDKQTIFKYECNFKIPKGFGNIGGILMQNVHHKDTYIKNIVLHDATHKVKLTCESWIHTIHENTNERIFFSNEQSYLKWNTPAGLRSLREKDLESLRGNGKGQRKSFETIYDYDMYNDLDDLDSTGSVLARLVLGGSDHPYPRRCRTGRPMTQDWESRTTLPFYVRRDEEFSDTEAVTYGTNQSYRYVHRLVPSLDDLSTDMNNGFSSFSDIELLYDKCVEIIDSGNGGPSVLRRLLKDLLVIRKSGKEIAEKRKDDKVSFSSYDDDEFCRQTLAGINPYSIQLVTDAFERVNKEWPLMSKLDDPEVYGPPESAITKEIIQQEIGKLGIEDIMTLEEALERKKLFMLDYHDMLIPYVNKVRELQGTTLYGSRTLMFLTSDGILKPLAIELTRPPNNTEKTPWKRVYTPCSGATTEAWLWKLAKAHVLAHDSCHHKLVSHWWVPFFLPELRTHCVTEPYMIATHRCLSKMHPVHRLLFPHFRYTMQNNALARRGLINAGGMIESTFALGKYSVELASDAYKHWRFDHEALPKDLINRGMAVEDSSAPHGVKLAIEDYPFANDGLLLWDAIKEWATAYVNHYYPQAHLVKSDEELQAWWTEIRTVGHGDKKDEPWWPKLETQHDLIGVVTTIMWVASGRHSAVNFGQYTAGYTPNRPTNARTKMPNEDPTEDETKSFLKNHEQVQSAFLITILDILSTPSLDEEYSIKTEAGWEAEPTIKAVFQK